MTHRRTAPLPRLDIRLEIGRPLASQARDLLSTQARRRLRQYATDLAVAAGWRAEPGLDVVSADSSRALQVRVNGRLWPYPPRTLRHLWLLLAPTGSRAGALADPGAAGGPDEWLMDAVADQASALVESLVVWTTEDVLRTRPWCLVDGAAARAYVSQAPDDEPPWPLDEADTAVVLAGLLRLGITLNRRETVVETVVHGTANHLRPEDLVELLADRLHRGQIQLHGHPSTLAGLFQGSKEGPEPLEPVRREVGRRFDLRVPEMVLTALPSMVMGVLSVRLNDLPGALIPAVPPDHAVVGEPPARLQAAGLAAQPALHPLTGVGLSAVEETPLAASGSTPSTTFTLVQVYADLIGRLGGLLTSDVTELELLLLARPDNEERGTCRRLVRSVLVEHSLEAVTRVLRALVEEGCSMGRLRRMLEGLAACAAADTDELVAAVRRTIGAYLTAEAASGTGTLAALRLDPMAEQWAGQAFGGLRPGDGDPPGTETEAEAIRDAVWRARASGAPLTLITGDQTRRAVRALLAPEMPELTILAESEVVDADVRLAGTLRF